MPTESRRLLGVVHVLQREGKERWWGQDPAQQHLVGTREQGDKATHGSLQSTGCCPPEERRVAGSLLTPSSSIAGFNYSVRV